MALFFTNIRNSANTTTTISPVYLDRARSIAGEHEKLSRQLAKGYDAKIARKVGELNTTALALKKWESASKVGHSGVKGLLTN